MASIDALEITNVRAFGPIAQRLKINNPLTLIVGHNGSGKTTIIESLKFGGTGLMPPTTAQAGFLHDPSLRGERSTLAKIAMVLTTANGARITCIRRMSVTIAKGSLSYKSLENTCKVERDGEDVSDAVLRTELDVQIPAWLGVSRAVLDRVIFCHQDESLWPLDTAKKVKETFDILFEAQKYAKAIAQIKILRKQHMDNLIGFKKDVQYTRQNKEEGARMSAKCTSLDRDIGAKRAESKTLLKFIDEAKAKSDAAFARANQAGEIVGRLEGKRIEARAKQESVDSLRQTLQELDDSDEVLEDLLAQYDERTMAYEEDRMTQRAQYDEVQRHMTRTRELVSKKERECGSYEAQFETHQRQLANRKIKIKETANLYSIRGFDQEIGNEQVIAFMDRISKMARDQHSALERARREAHDELQRDQGVLSSISERRTGFVTRKDNARQQMALHDHKINNLQKELDETSVDEGDKLALQHSLESTTDRLKSARTAVQEANWRQHIRDLERDLRHVEDEKQKLEDELLEATRTAGDSAQLDFARKELQDRNQRLVTITGAHKDRLVSIVGQEWQAATLNNAYQAAHDRAAARLADAEKQQDGCNREIEQLDYKLSKCQSDLKESSATVEEAALLLEKITLGGAANFLEELIELEGSRDEIKAEVDGFTLMQRFLNQCIRDANLHKVCRTCTRALLTDKEVDALQRNIERQRKDFETGQTNKDFSSVETQLAEMKAASRHHETWQRLREKDIPALIQQEEELTAQRAIILTRLEAHDIKVSDEASALREVEAISKTVASINKYHTDILELEKAVKDLTAQVQSAGMSRGLEVIKAENAKAKDEERVLRVKLIHARNEAEKADKQINTLELSLKDIQNNLNNADYQLRQKLAVSNQITELRNANIEQRQSITTVDESLQALAGELAQAQTKYDDTVARTQERDRKLQTEFDKLNNSHNELKMINRDIEGYIERGGQGQLERGRQEVRDLKTEVLDLETEQTKIAREVKALEERLRNHDETRRSIVDNLRFRRDLRGLESVRADIVELESHDAEKEKQQYSHEGQGWQLQYNELFAKNANLVGQYHSLDGQLKELMEKYSTGYEGAAEKFRKAQIDVATTEACVKDLAKYADALDKAIMKFHAIKMQEINRIIDELWRKTYQGTDVDTIFIRSDSEGKEGRSNKAYNYRVCMLKQQTEMDMRGRCSAGQKVLACIIIRLALAECFGVNCGLIALDEPTTNLDRENIQALATSLAELINVRKAQRNFQLIVITHDEDFLKCMQPSNYVDDYYRVGRDINQESIIKRESIHTLMR